MPSDPPHQEIPPSTVATPHDLPSDLGDNVPFWHPTLAESLKYLGFRWLLVLPAAALLAAIIFGICFDHRYLSVLWMIGPKWLIIAVALPLAAIGKMLRAAVRQRPDPFCIHCGYSLIGLPDNHRCPECGRTFSLSVIEEYRRDSHWFIQRYKMRHDLPATAAPFAAGAVQRKRSRDGT